MTDTPLIITHSDADGICSGAICLAAFPSSKVFFSHPAGFLDDLKATKGRRTVMISDVALVEQQARQLLKEFRRLSRGATVYYIDHHPMSSELKRQLKSFKVNVKHSTRSTSSELAYETFRDRISSDMIRIGAIGALADMSFDCKLLRSAYKVFEPRSLMLASGSLVAVLEGTPRRDYDFKRFILTSLSRGSVPYDSDRYASAWAESTRKEERFLAELPAMLELKGEVAYVVDPKFSLGKAAFYAQGISGKLVGMAVQRQNDTFEVSLRTVADRIDLNKSVSKVLKRTGGTGGGHSKACGARFPVTSLDLFIDTLSAVLRRARAARRRRGT